MGIVLGNTKLGRHVWHWSIPANKDICKTATTLCAKECYAKKGLFNMPSTRNALQRNYELALQDDFPQQMIKQIRSEWISVFRVHSSGEFFSAKYISDWYRIVSKCPQVLFFGYTRSWRDPEMLQVLTRFVQRHNVRFWYSCDQESGPSPISPYVRRAYMQTSDDDIPSYDVDLIFRTKRSTILKRTKTGILVCPAENGVTKVTCSTCRLCFSDRRIPKFQEADHERLSAVREEYSDLYNLL